MGSLYRKGTPLVPVELADEKQHRRALADGVNNALKGLLNNVSDSKRLKHNATSTTISDQFAGPNSLIAFMPANLTGSFAMERYYVDSQDDGKFTLNHVSTSTSDATIYYAIFG